MSNQPNGGPAFSGFELREDTLMVQEPDGVVREVKLESRSPQFVTGQLTVRDFFAAAALQSFDMEDLWNDSPEPRWNGDKSTKAQQRISQLATIASDCYALADAMIHERERKPE